MKYKTNFKMFAIFQDINLFKLQDQFEHEGPWTRTPGSSKKRANRTLVTQGLSRATGLTISCASP